jgi:hypothetical protein
MMADLAYRKRMAAEEFRPNRHKPAINAPTGDNEATAFAAISHDSGSGKKRNSSVCM